MTVLESTGYIGAWPAGLDPATNTSSGADEPYEDAIFGELFALNAKNQVVPDLASGYKFEDGGKTVAIFIRHGVTFQDGTPFNAAAVAWNIRRDLDPKNACICASSFPVSTPLSSGITTQGKYTMVMHLKQVYAPIIAAFTQFSSPNWIASPTAYQKMGEKAFRLKPVGAGPFEVVSDTLNSQLVLKKFPNYWQKGRPYLNRLIFKTIGSDQAALSAMQIGQAQLEQQTATLAVVQSAKKDSRLKVVTIPGTGTLAIQLNTKTAPFNNIKARQAIYYAVNPEALNKVVAGGYGTVSQSGDGPASHFPILTVPGYLTYNEAKAKALVKQLGGLNFTIIGGRTLPTLVVAVQSELAAAGIRTHIRSVNLAQLVQAFESNSWQLTFGGGGGLDPAIGAGGLSWRAISTGPFTGLKDPALDKMINEGTGTLNTATRTKIYKEIYAYIAKNAYIPFLYAAPFYNIATSEAHGPGVSTQPLNPLWADVWLGK